MLRYARTYDSVLIRQFLSDPKVARWSMEDGMTVEDLPNPRTTPQIWYIVALEGRNPLGLFIYEPRNTVRYVVHLAIAPDQWARSSEAFRGVNQWACQHIGMERITGEIPSDNAFAIRLAKKAGLEWVGKEPRSYRRDGALRDLLIFGINREQACQSAH